MLEDLLFNPFMFAVVYPLLILGVISSVFVLTTPSKPAPVPNVKFQSHVYVSSSWSPKKKVEPYKRAVREEPAEAHPIFDELEKFMRDSEARLEAASKAHKILFELGQNARTDLALCA